MSKRIILLATLLAALLLTSCKSRKDFIYLQDMRMGTQYPIETRYEAVIHSDDRLSITVSCKNPELAIPFNIYDGTFKVGADGNVTADATTKVNEKTKIEQGNYMNDPLVSIEFLNFKYTVLGAVSRNGTFSVNGDRITLLEAIANAGDLSAKARTNRVAVIREINGERQMFMHDLTSTDIFDSPCFYLQQNDIVYVEPKYRKKDSEDRGWQITTTLISLVTAACSLMWVLK